MLHRVAACSAHSRPCASCTHLPSLSPFKSRGGREGEAGRRCWWWHADYQTPSSRDSNPQMWQVQLQVVGAVRGAEQLCSLLPVLMTAVMEKSAQKKGLFMSKKEKSSGHQFFDSARTWSFKSGAKHFQISSWINVGESGIKRFQFLAFMKWRSWDGIPLLSRLPGAAVVSDQEMEMSSLWSMKHSVNQKHICHRYADVWILCILLLHSWIRFSSFSIVQGNFMSLSWWILAVWI